MNKRRVVRVFMHMQYILKSLKSFSSHLLPLLLIMFVVTFFLLHLPRAQAAGTPSIVSYQGRLLDSSGNLLGGSGTTFYFKFSIWDASATTSGSRLWPSAAPTAFTKTVREGVFNVNIGDTDNGYPDLLDYNFNTNKNIYLQVEVSDDNVTFQTMSPRHRIGSTPFAELSGAVSGTSTPSSFGTTTPIANTLVTIEATSTDIIPLTIRAFVGQVANLFQIQNSAGASLFSVNASGQASTTSFLVSGTATSTFAGAITVGAGFGTSTFGGGISATRLNITSGTSTGANGFDISAGCFSINGVCVGGATIDGSGAANRVTFWTDGDSLSYDDAFVWDNTNKRLGIGTTSPYTAFAVAGTVVADNFIGTSTTATSTFTGTVGIGTSTPFGNNPWFVIGSSTPTFYVDKITGNIGLGTTTPRSKLEVNFGTLTSPSSYASRGIITGYYGSSNFRKGTVYMVAEGTVSAPAVVTTSTFQPNAVTQFFDGTKWRTGAEVAVAVTAVSANTSVASELRFFTGTATGDGGAGSSAGLLQNMTLDSFGNLGIGTTSPYARLSVAGTVVADNFIATSTTATSTFANTVGIGTSTPFGNNPLFVIGTSTPLFYVDKLSGFIGLGTTTPQDNLHLDGTSMLQTVASSSLKFTGKSKAGSTAYSVAVSGRYAYVGDSNGLLVFDISTSTPSLIASVNVSSAVEATVLYGNYIVGMGYSGFQIFDISNPKVPKRVSSVTISSAASSAIAISGHYLYVGDVNLGVIHVYDISNVYTPQFVSRTVSGGAAALALVANGRYLYSANFGSALIIYDISNPASVGNVGSASGGSGTGVGISLSGSIVYTVTTTHKMQVISVANPLSPVVLSTIPVDTSPVSVFASGKYAYVYSYGSSTVQAYNVSDPSTPFFVARATTTNNGDTSCAAAVGRICSRALAVSGNRLYVATQGNSQLEVFNISGLDIATANIHSLEAGQLQVRQDVTAQGSLYVSGGGYFGMGGLFSSGVGSFSIATTTTLSSIPALSSSITDNNRTSVVDVLNIGHFSSTASGAGNGIGTGLLFSAQDNSTTSTSTARISSILTSVATTSITSALTFSTKNTSGSLTEWMRLDQNGFLGLGTTSPYASLSVVGSTGVVARMFSATSTTATSTFGILSIGSLTPTDSALLYVGTSSSLLGVDNFTGKVAIGTSTAALNNWQLTVQGGVCITAGKSCPAIESFGGLRVETAGSVGPDDVGDVLDIAEIYPATEIMEAGAIASIDTNITEKTMVRNGKEGDVIIGVVSTAPALSINGSDVTIGPTREATSTRPRIALAGRVPVKVNNENGSIQIGDGIAPSSVPGVGRKAKLGETTIGFALRSWSDSEDTNKVLVSVNLTRGWFSNTPDNSVDLSNTGLDFGGLPLRNIKAVYSTAGNWQIDENGVITVREVRTDKVKTHELCLDDICITSDMLKALLYEQGRGNSENVVTESLGEPPIDSANLVTESLGEPPVEEVITETSTTTPDIAPPDNLVTESLNESPADETITETPTDTTLAEPPPEPSAKSTEPPAL